MVSIVPDTSVIARWFLVDEPGRDRALSLRAAIVSGSIEAIAAPHVPIELATALVRASRRRRFDPAQVTEALAALRAFEIEVSDPVASASLAADIAIEASIHPADALFIAIAAHHTATLVTADLRLLRAARAMGCDALGLHEIGIAGEDV